MSSLLDRVEGCGLKTSSYSVGSTETLNSKETLTLILTLDAGGLNTIVQSSHLGANLT